MGTKHKKTNILIFILVAATSTAIGFFCYSNIHTPSKSDISGKVQNNSTISKDDSLNKAESSTLIGIAGNQEVIKRINTKKCQSALLDYYKNNDLDNSWEVYSVLKDGGLYTVPDSVQSDKNPKFTDFALIIQNAQTGKRKVVVFGFNDDESLAWTRDFDIPNEKSKNEKEAYFILISKQELSLSVYDYEGGELHKFPMACSAVYGNKQRRGDHKTPEGMFPITELLNSAYLSYDFKDGKGKIKGAYGPYFLRLGVPGYIDIGVHGTHDPGSMGKRVTEGCIRLRNENIMEIVPIVRVGTIVIITTSAEDAKAELK